MSQRLLSLRLKSSSISSSISSVSDRRWKTWWLSHAWYLLKHRVRQRAEEWAPLHRRRIKLGGLERDCWWNSNSGELQPHVQQVMGLTLSEDRSWMHSVVLGSDGKRRRQHYLNEKHIYSYINTNIYASKYLHLYAFVNHCAAFSLQNIAGDFNS